jgi:molecular chaperone HscB
VNEAYNTLKSPIKRAGYFLTTQGFDIENVSQSELDMDLLLEQMQLREKLAELPKDDTAMPVLENLKKDVKQKLLIQQSSFADDARSEKYTSAKKTFHELQFLYKLLSEIEENEERRLEY